MCNKSRGINTQHANGILRMCMTLRFMHLTFLIVLWRKKNVNMVNRKNIFLENKSQKLRENASSFSNTLHAVDIKCTLHFSVSSIYC